MKGMRIVITQGHLKEYSGSEMVTLELAEYLVTQGALVTIATPVFEKPMSAEFSKLKNVTVVAIDNEEFNYEIEYQPPDIAWIHHQLVPKGLLSLRAIERTKFIFHHMSPYHPQEFPILFEAENNLADVVLFNSQETKESLTEKGFKFSKPSLYVFGNPAPEIFKTVRQINLKKRLQKVLIVSNHLPDEVFNTAKLLEKNGISVDIAGINHKASYGRVTNEQIENADAIISIGKTVQYSLVAGRPIYCYDKFGGPGYINRENFKKARELNFSGRGFKVKTAEIIYDELTEGFVSQLQESHALRQMYSEELSLSAQMEQVLELIAKHRDKKLSKSDITSTNALNFMLVRLFERVAAHTNALDKITQLEDEIRATNSAEIELTNKLNEIYRSKLWKFTAQTRRPLHHVRKVKRRLALYKNKSSGALRKTLSQEKLVRVGINLTQLGYKDLTKQLVQLNDTLVDWDKQRKRRPIGVSVIVLVFNNIELTRRCIESVMDNSAKVDFELVVVDNGSDEETRRGLWDIKKKYPTMKLVSIEQNLNFALGNNVGFSYAKYDTCVFLNNDTYVTSGWLEALILPLKNDPQIKAVQPALYYPDGTIQCIGVVFSEKSALGYPIYAHKQKNIIKSRAFQAVTGACLAIRSSDFVDLKGFSPRYVNGQEDVDLCLRLIKSKGGVCYCAAEATVYHDESKTPGRGKYILNNRRTFIDTWQDDIRPDDNKYYKEDGYTIKEWKVDSEAARQEGVEAYIPVLVKRSARKGVKE